MPKQTFHNLEQEKKDRIYEASINEFARTRYDSCKLSNIIKEAGIPRGSFYQYFEDKFDLYIYVFDQIAIKKMTYLGDIIAKMHEMNFFDLWEELYSNGAKFGLENPKLIDITKLLLSSKDDIYDKLMGKNLKLAEDYYVSMIEINKKNGLIRPSVDSVTLAKMVIETTTNVAVDNLVKDQDLKETLKDMQDQIKKRIDIFRKGIETGE